MVNGVEVLDDFEKFNEFFDSTPSDFDEKDIQIFVEKLEGLVTDLKEKFERTPVMGKWESEINDIDANFLCSLFLPVTLVRFMIESEMIENVDLKVGVSEAILEKTTNPKREQKGKRVVIKEVGDLLLHSRKRNLSSLNVTDSKPKGTYKEMIFAVETDRKRAILLIGKIIEALENIVKGNKKE